MKIIFKFVNTVRAATQAKLEVARAKLAEENGQFLTDNAIYIGIALGLAIIAIGLVTNALQVDLAPAVTAKIRSFFT